MPHRPSETDIPIYSRLSYRVIHASFHDAWCVFRPNTDQSAMALLIELAEQTPAWVERCMRLRNRLAGKLKLKPMGSMADLVKLADQDQQPQVGAAKSSSAPSSGWLSVMENRFDEVLLSGQDKHLTVQFSVHRQTMPKGQTMAITVSSVVQAHNRLGQLYMQAIEPVHKRIVPAMLTRLHAAHAPSPSPAFRPDTASALLPLITPPQGQPVPPHSGFHP